MAHYNSDTISKKSSGAQFLKIIWKNENYFSLPFDRGYALDSAQFTFANATWCLRLFPNRDFTTAVSLIRLHSLVASQEIIYKIGLLMGDKEYFSNRGYSTVCYGNNGDVLRFTGLPPRTLLATDHSMYVPGGTLVITCHLISEQAPEEDGISRLCKYNSSITLSQNFKNLLVNGQDHDLILKVKDREFRVHRNILRARSLVFESMLLNGIIEKNGNVIDLSDCDPQAMDLFLIYVYSGKVESSNEKAISTLYYIADKFNMMCLKEECRDLIRNSLSCSNICNAFRLALNHKDDTLLRYATDFFANNTTEILVTAEWMSFLKDNVQVANDLYVKASRRWVPTAKKVKLKENLFA